MVSIKVGAASLMAHRLKRLPTMWETWVWSWVGKIPWRRKWQPTPVFLPGKSHGRRSLVGYSLWGSKESDTVERLHVIDIKVGHQWEYLQWHADYFNVLHFSLLLMWDMSWVNIWNKRNSAELKWKIKITLHKSFLDTFISREKNEDDSFFLGYMVVLIIKKKIHMKMLCKL